MNNIKEEYIKSNVKFGSFMQASKSKKMTEKAFQKKNSMHESQSKIIANNKTKTVKASKLSSIA